MRQGIGVEQLSRLMRRIDCRFGMIGSGMVVLNAPWGLAEAAAEIERISAT